MKVTLILVCLLLLGTVIRADDDGPDSSSAPPSPSQIATQQQIQRVSAETKPANPVAGIGADPAAAAEEQAKFDTEARWSLAGYNQDEVVYTILITNHDSRVLRCSTELAGFYFEKGQKLTISDRQSVTIFPNHQQQAGTWLGMDEKSGATYSVKCRRI